MLVIQKLARSSKYSDSLVHQQKNLGKALQIFLRWKWHSQNGKWTCRSLCAELVRISTSKHLIFSHRWSIWSQEEEFLRDQLYSIRISMDLTPNQNFWCEFIMNPAVIRQYSKINNLKIIIEINLWKFRVIKQIHRPL